VLAVTGDGPRIAAAAGAASPEWRMPSHRPTLGDADVHVVMASVEEQLPSQDALEDVLSSAERVRADRFVFARDRAQFVVAHGLLRTVLGRYLDVHPATLHFAAGAYGKPYLIVAEGAAALSFNLSHAGDLVLIAVARQRALGVDVERWVPDMEHDEVAHRFFSPAERAELQVLAPSGKVAGFFACWTRKEAYIKATGLGVSQGLDYFDVSLSPDRPARLLADRLASGNAEAWTLHDLAPAPGYSGAVVAEGSDWRLERLVVTPRWLADGEQSTLPAHPRTTSPSDTRD
jgi:4'-phosphopantetheinyl transferase